MTHDEILNMEAGRELDTLIAEKVMGWARWKGATLGWENPPSFFRTWELTSYGSFQPSTDISAAWDVIEKMEYNWSFVRDVGKCGSEYETIGNMLYRFIYTAPGMPIEGIVADTAPLAICRAALLAVKE